MGQKLSFKKEFYVFDISIYKHYPCNQLAVRIHYATEINLFVSQNVFYVIPVIAGLFLLNEVLIWSETLVLITLVSASTVSWLITL